MVQLVASILRKRKVDVKESAQVVPMSARSFKAKSRKIQLIFVKPQISRKLLMADVEKGAGPRLVASLIRVFSTYVRS